MKSADPVIILYKAKQGLCNHCVEVSNIWDNSPTDSISAYLKKVNPKVRLVTVTATDKDGHFNENLIPKDLIRYGVRFPQIIYVPGNLWDSAMNNLGPNSDFKLIDGVKVMNYKMVNDKLHYEMKYNIKIASDYEKWFNECIEPIVPIVPLKTQDPIKKIIKVESDNKKEYTISEFSNTCSFKFVSVTK